MQHVPLSTRTTKKELRKIQNKNQKKKKNLVTQEPKDNENPLYRHERNCFKNLTIAEKLKEKKERQKESIYKHRKR